ncbi:MAG: hypothetical protein WCY05_05185 [Candidatus Omnitrophota bacterium]
MFRFRGQEKDTGKWVEGYFYRRNDGAGYMILGNISCCGKITCSHFIVPNTLSISTGQFDKNRVEIFGSFEVDGKMSKGGDMVKLHYGIPPTSDTLVIEFVDNQVFNDFYVSGFWMRNLNKNRHSASLHKEYQNDLEIIGKQCDEVQK